MKKILIGFTLAACALALSVQAGEKSNKSACCASSQAKGGTCSAKATAHAGKSACCSKDASAKAADPFPVKGGVLLVQMARK